MYSNLEVNTLPFVQHKRAACWFYRFLSIVYDTYTNLLFWTERMRTQVLTLTRLDEPNLQVIDAGSGTGFTTQWIVQFVNSREITCVDQSPHQQKKANAKPDLNGCTFAIGDAEQIPMRPIGRQVCLGRRPRILARSSTGYSQCPIR